ncbi:MAG: hypothetical protein GF411_10475 [Candidatus Lokiarchaeota archaeon]|nr:hypothetical protein [Candidatus Lokiarchaeota archaeon]
MSESPICPYCGTNVTIQGSIPYDAKIKVNCPNCGSTFEYVSGFGAFSSDGPRRSSYDASDISPRPSRVYDGSSEGYDTQTGRRDYLDPDTPIPDPLLARRGDSEGPSCGKACGIICGLCCIMWILLVFLALISVIGSGSIWF